VPQLSKKTLNSENVTQSAALLQFVPGETDTFLQKPAAKLESEGKAYAQAILPQPATKLQGPDCQGVINMQQPAAQLSMPLNLLLGLP